MTVEITELPDSSVGPLSAQIFLGFAFHLEEMGAKVMTIGHITHNVEQPVSHASWEVGHFISRTLL
jgi:hypothetical protein